MHNKALNFDCNDFFSIQVHKSTVFMLNKTLNCDYNDFFSLQIH